jgi:hypothetical protein
MPEELFAEEIEQALASAVDDDVPLSTRTLRDAPADAQDQLRGR